MVCTDHNALKLLRNFKEPVGQVARWLQILSEYDFQVEHRPGSQHLNADALSRRQCQQCGAEQLKAAESHYTAVLTVSAGQESWLPTWNMDDFRLQQQADKGIHQMTLSLKDDSLPQSFPKLASADVQVLWNQRHSLKLTDGVLYRQWKDIPNGGASTKLQLVLPQHLISEVMSHVHDSLTGGHMGVTETLEKIRLRFYWMIQRHTVEEWCRKCKLHCSRKSPPKRRCAPMQLVQTDGPLKRIAMDILGPLPTTARGNKYILVVREYFSKWMEA